MARESWENPFVANAVARVRRASAFAVTTGGGDKTIQFDETTYDPYGLYVPASNGFVIQQPGKYLVTLAVQWQAAAAGFRYLSITRNGSANYLAIEGAPGNATDGPFQNVLTVIDLVQNDIIRAGAYQDSGASLNILDADVFSPTFTISQVS